MTIMMRKMVADYREQVTEMFTKAGFKNVQSNDSKQAPGLDIHEMGGCAHGARSLKHLCLINGTRCTPAITHLLPMVRV